MRKKYFYSAVAAVAAVPLFTVMLNASWFSHNSNVKTTHVDVLYNAKLANGKTLEAGKYKVQIPLQSTSPNLKFYHNGKLVANVPAKVKQEASKPESTQVDYSRKGDIEYMTEIRPSGLMKAYVLTASSHMKAGV